MYYIWQHDSAVDVSALQNLGEWQLRGWTTDTSIQLFSEACGPKIAFRIEARDTVITSTLSNTFPKGLDTITFSQFSSIDTISLVYNTREIETVGLDYLRASSKLADQLQWYDCATWRAIPNENDTAYYPTESGSYAVITQKEYCFDTTNCYQVGSLNRMLTILSSNELQSDEKEANFQWIDCNTNTPILGETKRNFIAQDTGIYAVIISAYGMKDTSACVPLFPVSIKETKMLLSELVVIYPNPTKGRLTIQRKDFNGPLNLKQLNIAGQLIQEVTLANELETYITLKGEEGIYFIQITNEQGETATFKVLKQ